MYCIIESLKKKVNIVVIIRKWKQKSFHLVGFCLNEIYIIMINAKNSLKIYDNIGLLFSFLLANEMLQEERN